jgi:hypothetical protein
VKSAHGREKQSARRDLERVLKSDTSAQSRISLGCLIVHVCKKTTDPYLVTCWIS